MGKLKNLLTWSFSRNRLFQDCRRAYFYHYYASWGGWDASVQESIRRAYILKNVRNVDAWIGDIVHQIIKWILENKVIGKDISFQEATSKSKQMLLRTWEQSRGKLWMKNVKMNLNLLEHYYNRDLSKDELTKKLQKVVDSLNGVYQCGIINLVSALPKEGFLRIDELDSFEFEGTKIFAIPDFAVYNGDYILYDWKTGKPYDTDILQLSCYVLYAIKKWNACVDKIKIVPVYLAGKDTSLTPVAAKNVQEMEGYIRDSIKEMKEVLSDVKENKIDIDKCFKTGQQWRCKNCKFQEICE
ncbi:MAG: PD-(D/E)XK nuclease family protein [Candidatus Omnitrophica bacterium]|nr:PD-(D/E)XK nuclease family protein [Candidatus Omnitrophota bacterium]